MQGLDSVKGYRCRIDSITYLMLMGVNSWGLWVGKISAKGDQANLSSTYVLYQCWAEGLGLQDN